MSNTPPFIVRRHELELPPSNCRSRKPESLFTDAFKEMEQEAPQMLTYIQENGRAKCPVLSIISVRRLRVFDPPCGTS